MDDTLRSLKSKRQDSAHPSAKQLRLRLNPSPEDADVEVALLCDLPGFGGPWLTQYAHKTARRIGPVAILHVDSDRIELELVSGRDPAHADPKSQSGAARIAQMVQAGESDLPQTLAQLASMDDQSVAHWIIVLPADRSRETRTIAREFLRWTLLAGGQSLSVEDAAEVLRDLVDGDKDAAQRHVTLSIMGSDGEGDAALHRVNSLVEWPGELKLGEGQAQMVPVQADWLGGFDWSPSRDRWDLLYRFFEPWGGLLRDHPEQSPAPTTISVAPTPPEQSIPKVDLSAFADPSPCFGLEARCPRDPLTQLAVDSKGVVHLLRQHQPATSATAIEEVRTILADLLATATWVREHLPLLQLTHRERSLDASATPVIHVLTNQGKAAVDLVQRFGSMAKIHLLQEAPGSAGQWVHTELN